MIGVVALGGEASLRRPSLRDVVAVLLNLRVLAFARLGSLAVVARLR